MPSNARPGATAGGRPPAQMHARHSRGSAPLLYGVIAVLVLGLILLVLLNPPHVDSEFDVLGRAQAGVPAELVLDAASEVQDRVVVARRIRVRDPVEMAEDTVIVANEIVFDAGGEVRVPSGTLTVVASKVVGGAFDVSGRPGPDGASPGTAGAQGGPGGHIMLAGAVLDGVQLRANGGNAGHGASGAAGQAGRNGQCGPSVFRIAERGEPGGDGGDGGYGGAGGTILVWYRHAVPEATVGGGAAGRGARGGPGGAGGRGCDGVLGAQPAQPPGKEGTPGLAGADGSNGSVLALRVQFSDVVRVTRAWLRDGDRSTAALLRDLRGVRAIDDPRSLDT
jgi:hypothetical protein